MSFNYIVHPLNGEKLSIFSNSGRELLKSYLRLYKTGGMYGLPDADPANANCDDKKSYPSLFSQRACKRMKKEAEMKRQAES